MGMQLPREFTEKMKELLGAQYGDFLASYDQPRNFGLRVNTLKISTQEFEKLAPFHLKKIPWVENGYYYEEQDAPARHPLYYAGLYYLQEPSAMTPASVLKVRPGERVLDLCAAPGGKATELGAKLCAKGLLVANDISASRAKALLKNIEVFGIPNAFVTTAAPAVLARQFPAFFDKILVDAPCSGEGMFRKEAAAVKAWTADKPAVCAKQQKEILSSALEMLSPGGQLLYSTCTFSPEENEQVVAWVLRERRDMRLLDIPPYEGFAPGISKAAELKKCVRIFPHKMAGEGHFLALMQKAGTNGLPQESGFAEMRPVGKMGKGSAIRGDEQAILTEFLSDVDMPMETARIEIRKGQAYYVPQYQSVRAGVPFLRNGLYLGELKKDRFEPSQSFAMALKKEQYAHTVDLDFSDERVVRYLKGETIAADTSGKGWRLVCVNGYPLGWGKAANGMLKNKYHAGWRMKY